MGAWIAAERWDEFVEDILLNHYDSAYAEAAKRSGRDDENAEFLMLPNTDDETYAKAAAELIAKYDVSKPPSRRRGDGGDEDGGGGVESARSLML